MFAFEDKRGLSSTELPGRQMLVQRAVSQCYARPCIPSAEIVFPVRRA